MLLMAAPSAGDEPVVTVANLEFHSAFWVNLHHLLYGAAWARRPDTGARRWVLPAPLSAGLSTEERSAWEATIDYYDRHVADRDLLTGSGMTRLRVALAAEDLASDAVGNELRTVLERAAPIYRRHFWPAHDRANRLWIQDTTERLRAIEREIVTAHERLFGRPWFAAPVRVDIVWMGRAYTSLNPMTLATVSPAESAVREWTGVEMVLHEVCHELILPVRDALNAALGDDLKQHGGLWHVVQFYMTGTALAQILAARGISYTPYMYSTGLFDRAWGQYRKLIEEFWFAYVRGEITRTQAIERTIAALRSR
jgi:hypothetical protein